MKLSNNKKLKHICSDHFYFDIVLEVLASGKSKEKK